MCVQCAVRSKRLITAHHFLRLAQIDVFLALAARLAFLNVHDSDERHGPAPQEEDCEEYDDDGGGANQLPLLDGLQAQMEAQGVGDGASQTWQREQRQNKNVKKNTTPVTTQRILIFQRLKY